MGLSLAKDRIISGLTQEAISIANARPSEVFETRLVPVISKTFRICRRILEGTYNSPPVHYVLNTTPSEFNRDISNIRLSPSEIKKELYARAKLLLPVDRDVADFSPTRKERDAQKAYDPLFEDLVDLGSIWTEMIEKQVTLNGTEAQGPQFQEMLDLVSHYRRYQPERIVEKAIDSEEEKEVKTQYTELSASFALKIIDLSYLSAQDPAKIVEIGKVTPGIISCSAIMGAVVFIYDSSKEMPPSDFYPGLFADATNTARGRVHAINLKNNFGVVAVDVNQAKYLKDATQLSTLRHELVHQVFHILQLVIDSLDTQHDPALLGALIGRSVTKDNMAQELELLKYERAYLNELHSSYIGGKQFVFDARESFYTTKKMSNGSIWANHWDLLGSSDRVRAGKYFFTLMQGFHVVDELLEQNRETRDVPWIDSLRADWSELFYYVGGCLQVSLGIAQAWRLIKPKWDQFIVAYPEVADYLNTEIIPAYSANKQGLEMMRPVWLGAQVRQKFHLSGK